MAKKGNQNEELELDKARKGKKADDCSVHVEDMIISREADGNINLSKELRKAQKRQKSPKID